jgi:hypothetical protein
MSSIYDNLVSANKLALLLFRSKDYDNALNLLKKVIHGLENHYPDDILSMSILKIQHNIFLDYQINIDQSTDIFIPELTINSENNSNLLFFASNLSIFLEDSVENTSQSSMSKPKNKSTSSTNLCKIKNCPECTYIQEIEKNLLSNKSWDGEKISIIYENISKILDILVQNKNFEKAETITKRLIKVLEKYLKTDDDLLLYLYDDLSNILHKNDKLIESKSYLKFVTDQFEKKYGLDNENTAKSLVNYGNILYLLKKYEEAEINYKKGLISFEFVYGKESIKLNIILENLAKLYEKVGDLDKTEFLCHQILALYNLKNDPLFGINVYEIELNLIRILYRLNKFEEAEINSKKSLANFEKNFGKEDKRCIYLLKIYEKILQKNTKSKNNSTWKSIVNKLKFIESLPNTDNYYFGPIEDSEIVFID